MNEVHTIPRTLRCLFLLLLLLPAAALADGPQRRIVAFGDSLVDSGNVFFLTGGFVRRPFAPIPDGPYLIGGPQFSNGPTWVQQLAGKLRARPTAGPSVLVPRLFSNYAFGGARARDAGTSPSLTDQVTLFLDEFRHQAPRSALYAIAIAIGGNDLRDAAADPDNAAPIIGAAVQSIADNLRRLVGAGARHFVIANQPNLSGVPAITLQNDEQLAIDALVASLAFNGALQPVLESFANLPGLEVDIDVVDAFTLTTALAADPAQFGLADGSTPCLRFGVRRRAICRDRDEHFYWDAIHPTRAGHGVIAKLAFEAISE